MARIYQFPSGEKIADDSTIYLSASTEAPSVVHGTYVHKNEQVVHEIAEFGEPWAATDQTTAAALILLANKHKLS